MKNTRLAYPPSATTRATRKWSNWAVWEAISARPPLPTRCRHPGASRRKLLHPVTYIETSCRLATAPDRQRRRRFRPAVTAPSHGWRPGGARTEKPRRPEGGAAAWREPAAPGEARTAVGTRRAAPETPTARSWTGVERPAFRRNAGPAPPPSAPPPAPAPGNQGVAESERVADGARQLAGDGEVIADAATRATSKGSGGKGASPRGKGTAASAPRRLPSWDALGAGVSNEPARERDMIRTRPRITEI